MKLRLWVGIGGLVAVAAVAAVVVWQMSTDDDTRFVATLTDMQHENTDDYVFAEWWHDGSRSVRLTADGDDLIANDPLTRREGAGDGDLDVTLPVVRGTNPAAIAALPGNPEAPWVAVSFESKNVASDDLTTTEHPLVWTGNNVLAGEAAVLPVEIRSNESGGAIMTADAAIARIGETDLAVASTSQLDSGSLDVCDLSDCRWNAGALPGGLPPDSVGSTGGGLVALTGEGFEDAAIWYADDVHLTWKQIGTAPPGMHLEALQDGADQATLVWRDRDDDAVAIQTVHDGEVADAVKRTPVTGGMSNINTALEVDGRWYLGGARPSTARISVAYQVVEATVWEQGDESWTALDDALLRNQPDQQIEALFIDADGDVRAVSASPVQRNTMTWRFTREAE